MLVEVISAKTHPNSVVPDFNAIQRQIIKDPTMLHPTVESLEASYQKGLAVAMTDGEKVVGYMRFSPLLTREMTQSLGLGEHFPEIWELGSVIISDEEEHRGKGYSHILIQELLDLVRKQVEQRELLIIGTTKTMRVLSPLNKSNPKFSSVVHTTYSMIAPFTCVCTPDLGCGFQLSRFCPERVTHAQLENLPEIAQREENHGKVPCTMFVSDTMLAETMDNGLRNFYLTKGILPRSDRKSGAIPLDPQALLVEDLKSLGYSEA